jgi:hypothetical protein
VLSPLQPSLANARGQPSVESSERGICPANRRRSQAQSGRRSTVVSFRPSLEAAGASAPALQRAIASEIPRFSHHNQQPAPDRSRKVEQLGSTQKHAQPGNCRPVPRGGPRQAAPDDFGLFGLVFFALSALSTLTAGLTPLGGIGGPGFLHPDGGEASAALFGCRVTQRQPPNKFTTEFQPTAQSLT